jgi:low affinity Fe/Cu permease
LLQKLLEDRNEEGADHGNLPARTRIGMLIDGRSPEPVTGVGSSPGEARLLIPGVDEDARKTRPECYRQHRLAGVREETDRPAAASSARRSPFERFVEAAYQWVSRPRFFIVCVAIVAAWVVSLPLWSDTKAWQVAIHTVASVLTLLLVALLENAGRRSAEAAQEKLNVIAEALAALMASRALEDHTLEEAVTRLRDAVGLEERH